MKHLTAPIWQIFEQKDLKLQDKASFVTFKFKFAAKKCLCFIKGTQLACDVELTSIMQYSMKL